MCRLSTQQGEEQGEGEKGACGLSEAWSWVEHGTFRKPQVPSKEQEGARFSGVGCPGSRSGGELEMWSWDGWHSGEGQGAERGVPVLPGTGGTIAQDSKRRVRGGGAAADGPQEPALPGPDGART